MCGIIACKILNENYEINRKKIMDLTGRLNHRGPDFINIHIEKSFWMGHTRLSIVDPVNGNQPLINKEKDAFLIVNGEIYNHLELRKELEINSNDFSTLSDSEIIIHGYKKINNAICDKLIGMFSFVLSNNNGDFLVCRDKIGIKPLYMGKSKDGNSILFSSELKGIVDQCEPEDLQLFPAGHYWTIETGLKKYYKPEWDTLNYSLKLKNFSTIEECKIALENAVIKRCMADVEIGLLLSGGLDSSIIGAIMSKPNVRKYLKATKGKIKSFAVGQEGSPDILAARIVSKQLDTEHIEAIFTPEMAFEELDNIIYYAETYEPELIRSCIPNYFLAKKASQYVKVVLTGEGSDELWSGYLYFNDCKNSEQLQEENRRILKAVEFVNLQRADRMTMAFSLEARVPFFDVDNIAVAMKFDPQKKLIFKNNKANTEQYCEKYILREMYKDMVSPDILWRTKAMQCEGVGMTWVQTLQNYISNNLVTDDEFTNVHNLFPNNTPKTKEEYYYRKIFDKYYPNCDKFVHVWDKGCRAAGASWKSNEYTREGLCDINKLKRGHSDSDLISI